MIGVEGAARAGYVTNSGIYGLIGFLAVGQAPGTGGSTSGGREAVRTIASGPLGRTLLDELCFGLAGYVMTRTRPGGSPKPWGP